MNQASGSPHSLSKAAYKGLSWIAALLALAVIVAMFMQRERKDQTQLPEVAGSASLPAARRQPEQRAASPAAQYSAESEQQQPLAIMVGKAIERAVESLGLSTQGDASVPQSVTGILNAYSSDELGAFVAYCERNDIARPAADPAAVASTWNQFRAWFSTAIPDTDNIVVRRRIVDGAEIVVNDAEYLSESSRDEARGFWTSLPGPQRQTLETIIPLVAMDLDQQMFTCRLGLELAFNPATSRWVLLHVRIYDLPPSTHIVDPLL